MPWNWIAVTSPGVPKCACSCVGRYLQRLQQRTCPYQDLVKDAIVLIDAHPFKDWYESHYGVKIGLKKTGNNREQPSIDLSEKSEKVQKKLKSRQANRTLESALDHQFASGRLLAKITSRPGQTGRCDGYVLEGPKLAFYQKAMTKK